MDIGAKLLLAFVQQESTAAYFAAKLREDFFFGGEATLFKWLDNFARKHHKLPARSTVDEQFQGLVDSIEPPDFYLEKVIDRYVHKRVNRVLTACNEHMQQQDAWTAMNMLTETLSEVRAMLIRESVLSFGDDAPTLISAELKKKKLQSNDPGVTLGWPTFDLMCGGLRGGDVLSIVGRPAMGKTMLLLYSALHAWKTGKTVLLVSMEMLLLPIIQRLMALHAQINASHLKQLELSSAQMKKLMASYKDLHRKEAKLWIVDGNLTTTAEDVFSLCAQYNPDALVVDGAYLLGHHDKRLDKYKRAEMNIELIKRRCSSMNIPAALSYQFNRQATKKLKLQKEKGGLEDIAFTDAIGQVSSVVLGLFEEDGVETLKSRTVEILKGRGGEIGSFRVSWDWIQMDFTELPKENLKTLQFI